MKFTKMHGIGNDYIYINGFEGDIVPEEMIEEIVVMSDRHKGIGGDGVIYIMPSDVADAKMRMFNADGSEGKMCGNGIRCEGKHIYEHDISHNNPLKIELLYIDYQSERYITLERKEKECELNCRDSKFCLSEVDEYNVLEFYKNKIYKNME